jgi:hypothetical protein
MPPKPIVLQGSPGTHIVALRRPIAMRDGPKSMWNHASTSVASTISATAAAEQSSNRTWCLLIPRRAYHSCARIMMPKIRAGEAACKTTNRFESGVASKRSAACRRGLRRESKCQAGALTCGSPAVASGDCSRRGGQATLVDPWAT